MSQVVYNITVTSDSGEFHFQGAHDYADENYSFEVIDANDHRHIFYTRYLTHVQIEPIEVQPPPKDEGMRTE